MVLVALRGSRVILEAEPETHAIHAGHRLRLIEKCKRSLQALQSRAPQAETA